MEPRAARAGEHGRLVERTRRQDRRAVDHGWIATAPEGFAISLEKVAGLGEDAPPLLLVDDGLLLVGAFDGLGGAGSARRRVRGEEHAEAYIASRLARAVVRRGADLLFERDRAQLHRWLDVALDLFDERNPATAGRLRGRLARELPTTVACALVAFDDDGFSVRASWAGDSRAWVLTPSAGLQALTLDHVRAPDPLSQLINDSPLDNVVCRSSSFAIEHREVALRPPALVLVATDGVFGYVRTPGELEHHLLDSLVTASSVDGWADDLADRVRGWTQDDASLALGIIGSRSLGDLQERFATRAAAVRADQFEPMAQAGGADALRRARAAAWERCAPGHLELVETVASTRTG